MIHKLTINNIEVSIKNSSGNPYKIIVFVGDNGCGKTTLLRMLDANSENKTFFLHQDIKYRESLKTAGDEMTRLINGKDIFGKEIKSSTKKNVKITNLIKTYFNNNIINNTYDIAKNVAELTAGVGKQVGTTHLVSGDFNIPIEAYTKLDTLSSGEQEILIKLFVLAERFDESFKMLLLDEPETALHPKWQKNIVSLYKNVLNEEQQMIIATHSENILKEALSDDECVVFKIRRQERQLALQKIENSARVLPYISFSEIQYIIFDIPSNDYHNELFGEIQNRFRLNTVKSCDIYLKKHLLFDKKKLYKRTIFFDIRNSKTTKYYITSTWIRNEIDHPPVNGKTFVDSDLKESIEFMRKVLCVSENKNEEIFIKNNYNFDSDLDFNEYLVNIALQKSLEDSLKEI